MSRSWQRRSECSPGASLGRREPVRTCAGCGRRAPRSEMRRFVLASAVGRGASERSAREVGLEWRRAGGRGSYLHQSGECARKFVARKKLVPGLRARVARDAREALVATAELS